MIRSGRSSSNFCRIAACSPVSLRAPTESGSSTTRALERSWFYQRVDRRCSNALRIALKAGDVVEVSTSIAEADDMRLVLGREMTDLVEGGDFVAAIRREGHTPADKENAHRRAPAP